MIFRPSTIKNLFFTYICPTFYGKTPSTPTNTTSTVNQNSIPVELMPYATGMLSAASDQLYTKNDAGDITGYQPYKPYSTNAQDYVAPFSSMQTQAQNSAAGLQTPGQFAPATQLAGASGIGQLGTAQTAQNYGAQGAGYGQNAANVGAAGGLGYGAQSANLGMTAAGTAGQGYGAGAQYAQQATDPTSVSAYMSPYIQNVMQQQGRELNRNYDISGVAQQGQATQAGAFGGSREALMASENERSRNMALNKMQAEGLQSAYSAANQNQQFGANLNLQGMQAGNQALQTGLQGIGQGITGVNTALQGYQQGVSGAQAGLAGVQGAQQGYTGATNTAATLGNLGSAELAAQQGVIGTQSTMGGQQQAQNQAAIDQAVLNYQNEQQQPYLAAGTMSSLIRGTPTGNLTTQNYQAQPSALTQIGGALGTAGSLYGAATAKAKGGIIQAYAGGGSVEGNIESQLQDMDDNQLQQIMNSSPSESIKGIAKRILAEHAVEGRAKGGIIGYAEGDLVEARRNKEEFHPLGYDLYHKGIKGAGKRIKESIGKSAEYLSGEASDVLKGIGGVGQKLWEGADTPTEEPSQVTVDNTLPTSILEKQLPNSSATPQSPTANAQELPVQKQNVADQGINSAALANRSINNAFDNAGLTGNVESNAAPEPQQGVPVQSGGIANLQAVYDAYDKKDAATAAKSVQDIMAEETAKRKEAGIDTSQEASATERKQIMDERANAGVEQKRQMYLRMGEFFANWGSTPGAPLAAGLKAMKDTLPGVMDDSKAHIKLMRDINKSENDLNHAVRLEQMGLFDKASLIKEKASDRILQHKEAVAGLAIKEQIRQETFAQQKELEAMQQGGAFSRAQLTADRYDSEGKSDNVLVDNLQKQIVMDSKSLENLDESSIEYKNLVNDITNNREKLRLLNKTSSAVPPPLTKEQIKKNWARQNNIG